MDTRTYDVRLALLLSAARAERAADRLSEVAIAAFGVGDRAVAGRARVRSMALRALARKLRSQADGVDCWTVQQTHNRRERWTS